MFLTKQLLNMDGVSSGDAETYVRVFMCSPNVIAH